MSVLVFDEFHERGPGGEALAPCAGERITVSGELWESPGVSYLAVDSDGVRR